MKLTVSDLEQLARAEISKRYGGVVTLSELTKFFSIPNSQREYYLFLCTQVEADYITYGTR